MQIGIRAHDIDANSIIELAKKMEQFKINKIQFAPLKSMEASETVSNNINIKDITNVRNIFSKHNIEISVMGCYVNLVTDDEIFNKSEYDKFSKFIKYTNNFGATCIGTETGSIHKDQSFHIENDSEIMFNKFLTNFETLVRQAENDNVYIGIEPVANHVINSPEKVKQMLNYFNSENVYIIFDPVNLLTDSNYVNAEEIFDKSIELFGDKIKVVHLKDFDVIENKYQVVPATFGKVKYNKLLKKLFKLDPNIDLIIDETNPIHYSEIIKNIERILKEC